MSTIVDLLRRRADERPDVRAYRFLRDGESAEDSRTWSEMDRRARAIGTTLRAMGASGTNVLMLFPPGIDFIEGYFGCLYAGAVPVPAYPPEPARLQRTLPRVQAIVADAGARFALTIKPLLALADMVFAQAPELRLLEWLATDAVEDAAAERWARPAISGDTLAMLQYTSGSTGTPKGVLLSHTNMLANAECVFSSFEFTPDDRILSWLPTFHDMGFMSGVLQPLYSGCPVVGLPPTSFLEKPYRWLAAIHATRATVSGGPNFAYDLCVRKTTPEQRAALDLSCWKLAYNGAETVRLDTVNRFAETFAASGFKRRAMFPCFGLAEATLIVSGGGRDAEPVSLRVDKAGLEAGEVREGDGATFVASGRTVQGATVAIVDPETRRRADADRIGEIWVAGPSVGRGYWQRVEDTEAVFGARLADDPTRTYVRTGDLGFQRDGELFICGRVKDLIIIRGANHYPQDIELTVERAHAAIRPGCVAAFAMEIADEERVVVVAEVDRRYHGRDRRRLDRGDRRAPDPAQKNPDAEALDVDQLFWVVRDAIAERHELEPHDIVLVRAGSIHKTSSGKLQRGACRQAFRVGELEVLAEWRADGTKRHSDVPSTERPARSRPTTLQPAMPRTTTGEIPKRPTVTIEALRKPAVVVVDSDPARRDIAVRTLADAHFTVIAAEAAAKALQLVGESTFATAISDDLALLGQIAATSSHTARLLVTGFDDPEAVREAITTGRVTSVLSRKAGPQQIHAAVSEAVEEWVSHHTDLAIRGIETWLSAWLANRLQINRQAVDLDAQVASYGLDSLSIVEVQTALSDWLGFPVPETLIRGKASIRNVARRLVSASEVSLAPAATREDVAVAIVGMGCAVPGARDVDALWQLVHSNVDAITETPADRTTNARWGGFVDGVKEFDAAFFGIAPRDAAHVDPQHRLLLETTWQALEDAGISPQELAGSDAGVFVGISGSDFLRTQPELAISDAPSAAAQRLSYFFNLKGPSFAVDSGDGSSVAALHLAVTSLQRGECKLAIVAGVNLVLTADTPDAYAKARLLASDGRCKPFDARADGSVLSDGCGVVVLKRSVDARSGANRIRAQILGTALRQNGRGHGLTAPNEAAQELVIREALRRANVPAADIRYTELNARGVPAVDAIEARALSGVLGTDRPPDRPCMLGALKANIGDTRAAAGILGVIKAALVLEHDDIPQLLHLRELNREIALGTTLAVPATPQPWPAGERRVACVNNFGLLGTNGVVVMSNEIAPQRSPTAEYPAHVLCASARSESALRVLADRYAAKLATTTPEQLPDVCFTANLGRADFAHRVAITATNAADMRDKLLALARGEARSQRAVGRGMAKVAFLFAGRGAAAPEMAKQLFTVEPRFRSVMQRCDRVVRDVLKRPLLPALYATTGASTWDPILQDPATVAIEYALADLWQSWGVYPDVVMGHDVGEYAAAAVAGALGLEDAVLLACERTKRLRELDVQVAAIAVVASETELDDAIKVAGAPVTIAEHDARRAFRVVGAPAAIQALTKHLAADQVTVMADASPLHTPLVQPILDGFAAVAAKLQLRLPSIALVSNVTGKPYTAPLDADYWRRHTSECVHYERGLREIIRQGTDVFLEISPRHILTRPSEDTVPGIWLPSLDPDFASDWEHMLMTLGALYERGVSPNWSGFYHGQDRRRIGLPFYPFEHRRCWPD